MHLPYNFKILVLENQFRLLMRKSCDSLMIKKWVWLTCRRVVCSGSVPNFTERVGVALKNCCGGKWPPHWTDQFLVT